MERMTSPLQRTAGGNGPWNLVTGKLGKEFFRAWEGADLFHMLQISLRMQFLQLASGLLADDMPSFTLKRAGDQAAAHPHPPVNAPSRKRHPHFLQRFPPSQHMLIDA